MMTRLCLTSTLGVLLLFAGGLRLEIGHPEANAEAKALRAVLVARVTACHEPAKSTIQATWIREERGRVVRQNLKVTALGKDGLFAVVGDVPTGSWIDLELTNPEFAGYAPRTLVRTGANGPDRSTVDQYGRAPLNETQLLAKLRR